MHTTDRLIWRWDQGHLNYFQLGEIVASARTLSENEGRELPSAGDPDWLRSELMNRSELPFSAPPTHLVWRNYGRTFASQILATSIDGKLHVTELAKAIASGEVLPEDYLLHHAARFAFSSPAFDGYAPERGPQFPIPAIVKTLQSRYEEQGLRELSLDEIFGIVVGNQFDGTEATVEYRGALNRGLVPAKPEERQVREMIQFYAQLPFLTWERPNLIFDVSSIEDGEAAVASIEPIVEDRLADASSEILRLGVLPSGARKFEGQIAAAVNEFDLEFVEGSRSRRSHLRIERSPELRRLYFKTTKNSHVCQMCGIDTSSKYAWVDQLIELHHLLPLSSPVRVESDRTSLNDVVGLCPSCHRAVHKYYAIWLRTNEKTDFANKDEATAVYEAARKELSNGS